MATGVAGGEGGSGGFSKDRKNWADSKVYSRKSFKGLKTNIPIEKSSNLGSQELNFGKELGFEVGSDDSSSLNRVHRGGSNPVRRDMHLGNGISGAGFSPVDIRVSINLAHKTKKERRELRRKLEGELNSVRSLVKKLERSGSSLRSLVDDGNNDVGKLKRVHSEVGSVGWHDSRPIDQLSITVPEHSQGASENVEKEKRTPKANPFYQSSEFILGKERIPPPEQNKKSKGMGKKNGDSGSGIGMSNSLSKVFKNCSLLLDKVMKHKHGWVFNTPVDVKALGLHDYFTIIKHPMDLGTVKSRLNTNWYKSPKEFAEDVRLTFHNAMTYNPKGHDVYIMAEILSKMFEEKWSSVEAEYMRELRAAADNEGSLLTPTSRKAPQATPLPPPPADMTRTLDKSESMTNSGAVKSKNPNSTPTGRTPVPKKPKAKDPHKRDMTYVEKQKLSTDLQNLPSEKLDNVVQIIRKRNPSLCQNDDEIEVDIDSVDTETLWELDRFVMNYKKNMSKIKKKTELSQGTGDAEQIVGKNEAPSILNESKENKAEETNDILLPPVQREKQAGTASRSNSSRSSSSGSGSSSSDSDSDTSST
ncbi:transcription factor GTE4 [Beta vulgaris subsp. vulgaris]|uniref:transcription factor GTE4 n=1 Tax=Beta vulgaris subsp. vulgaris TaxID=3555 RepID=UPI002036EBCC|nr:transcription factor GTE4 [Beta vulgaris subsp. vulgaris]